MMRRLQGALKDIQFIILCGDGDDAYKVCWLVHTFLIVLLLPSIKTRVFSARYVGVSSPSCETFLPLRCVRAFACVSPASKVKQLPERLGDRWGWLRWLPVLDTYYRDCVDACVFSHLKSICRQS